MIDTRRRRTMYIENNTPELKECYTDNIVRDIVAFLNTDGGRIFMGLDDNDKNNLMPGGIDSLH